MFGLDLYLEWESGLDNNRKLLYKHRMWEQGFGKSSTFYKYFIKEKIPEKATTILAYDDGLLAGVLIFPHLSNMSGEFSVLNKNIDYVSFGEVQLYVKPEYRKHGIAKAMVQKLNRELYVRHNKCNSLLVVQAVQNALPIAERFMKDFFVAEAYEDDKKELETYLFMNYKPNKKQA